MAFEGTLQEFTIRMHGHTLEHPYIEAQQGDTASRKVRIHLKTFGGADYLIPYGATAVLSVDKTDGHKVLNECEIEDSSTVIIPLTSQTLACPGKQLSQIYIFTDKGDIKTQKFYIHVPKAVYDDDAVESADEYGILQDLIASIEAMDDGVTFTPHVSEDGTLTWSNDGGLDNPESVNIMGPEGPEGPKGNNGAVGERGTGILKVSTMPQAYTTPIGDYEPQYRKSISEIIKQTGVSEVLIGDIIEFSWYHYVISYLDDEYAYISQTRISIRGPQGEKGDPGEKGSDASVTKENISSALGYTPAKETEVSSLKSDFDEMESEVTEAKSGIAVLESRPVNNNILINSNFANPVNQRGNTSYTYSGSGQMYSIDRWCFDRVGQTLTINDGRITLTTNGSDHMGLRQFIENLQKGVYTLSAKVNGVIYSKTFNYNHSYVDFEFENGIRFCFSYVSSTKNSAIVIVFDKAKFSTVDIAWIKLEEGSVATPYVPRLYAEELELCQRYYQVKRFVDSSVYVVETNRIIFALDVSGLRTTPTANFESANICKNNTNVDGFSIALASCSLGIASITATKNNHGLSFTDCISGGGRITFDAEL